MVPGPFPARREGREPRAARDKREASRPSLPFACACAGEDARAPRAALACERSFVCGFAAAGRCGGAAAAAGRSRASIWKVEQRRRGGRRAEDAGRCRGEVSGEAQVWGGVLR